MLNTVACCTQQSPSRSSGIPCSQNVAVRTTETTPMQHLNTCDGKIEITNETVLGIAREYLGCPLHDGHISSRALKSYTLLN